jgi:hypothetical protein
MKIQIEPHTLERAQERGATEEEIRDTIETGFDISARGNRKGKAKIYDFKQERLGKYYEQKRLEIIYVDEKDVIITITVYVFYGEWKA